MRVISLVPSLTETLAECGVNLVGRTRFCIHPGAIKSVPVVGGTKDLHLEKLRALKPDLLILDQEENLPWMKSEAPCHVHVFHATSVQVMPAELQALAKCFQETFSEAEHQKITNRLLQLAARFERVLGCETPVWSFANIPGLIQTVPRGQTSSASESFKSIEYIIWKNPWMKVGSGTYIHSVLKLFGAGPWLATTAEKYPKFTSADISGQQFCLFSSEPYPFHRDSDKLQSELQYGRAVIVDGEAYSWFGLRNLLFLESVLLLQRPHS